MVDSEPRRSQVMIILSRLVPSIAISAYPNSRPSPKPTEVDSLRCREADVRARSESRFRRSNWESIASSWSNSTISLGPIPLPRNIEGGRGGTSTDSGLDIFCFAFLGLKMLVWGLKYENENFSAVGERGVGDAKGSRRLRKSDVSAGELRELELDGDGDLEGLGRRDALLDSGWRGGRTTGEGVN